MQENESAPGVAPIPAAPLPSAGPKPPAVWKTALAWCLARGGQLARALWNSIAEAARYYWGIREPLREYIAGFGTNLRPESVRLREVRLSSHESHDRAEHESAGWKVVIPARCVVCGEKTQNPPLDEELSVDNAARAFWIPIATAMAGAALGLFLWNRWLLAAAIPLGVVLGYLMREKVSVRLRLARCDQHVTRTNVPQVLAWGNTLVLRFGNKLVRKAFLYGETMDSAVPQPEATYAGLPDPVGQSAEEHVAETIPLAEGPSPDASTIRHDQPPLFGSDDEPPSPLVP